MEASSSLQHSDLDRVRLKRFNLNEQLRKIASSATLKEPNHTIESPFDWQFYLAYYEDLSRLSSHEEAYEHWNNCGKAEGRLANEAELEQHFELVRLQIPENFDYEQYLTLNPDLKTKLRLHRYKQYRATEHYLKYGRYDGRPYHLHPPSLNPKDNQDLYIVDKEIDTVCFK